MILMNSKVKSLVLISAFFLSFNVQAKLNGKNVVLVHGLQTTHLKGAPDDAGLQNDANEYWQEFWGSRAEAILYWSANDRIAGGIKDDMRVQIKRLEAQRTCLAGCVFITHSTGDLVLRDALKRLNQWGVNPNNFKVIASLDFAGAGGGSELASLAVNIAEGGGIINSLARSAVDLALGFKPRPGNLGVLYDLRPSSARTVATTNGATPRLRFAGTGSEFLRITKAFIPGKDDAVVGMHSSCGSRWVGSYDSCDRNVRADGSLRRASAPSSLYFNHFPVLMGAGTDHFEVISNDRSGYMTTVVNDTTRGVRLDFDAYTKRRFLRSKVRRVRDSDRKSMSATVFETLNR